MCHERLTAQWQMRVHVRAPHHREGRSLLQGNVSFSATSLYAAKKKKKFKEAARLRPDGLRIGWQRLQAGSHQWEGSTGSAYNCWRLTWRTRQMNPGEVRTLADNFNWLWSDEERSGAAVLSHNHGDALQSEPEILGGPVSSGARSSAASDSPPLRPPSPSPLFFFFFFRSDKFSHLKKPRFFFLIFVFVFFYLTPSSENRHKWVRLTLDLHWPGARGRERGRDLFFFLTSKLSYAQKLWRRVYFIFLKSHFFSSNSAVNIYIYIFFKKSLFEDVLFQTLLLWISPCFFFSAVFSWMWTRGWRRL